MLPEVVASVSVLVIGTSMTIVGMELPEVELSCDPEVPSVSFSGLGFVLHAMAIDAMVATTDSVTCRVV